MIQVPGLDNYKFGRKNNWRRWQWNIITKTLKNLGKKPQDSICLYLRGPDDKDREVALQKGFKSNNMIAVDINKENIKAAKQNGNNAIFIGLGPLLSLWGKQPKIDIIVADFCCGMTETVKEFINDLLLCEGLTDHCILAINLLRGRDPNIKIIQEVVPIKHRGMLFMKEFVYRCFLFDMNLGQEDVGHYHGEITIDHTKSSKKKVILIRTYDKPLPWRITICEGETAIGDLSRKMVLGTIGQYFHTDHNIWKNAERSCFSYKSTSGQIMDSIVFHFTGPNSKHQKVHTACNIPGLKGKIAALKAWKTMRDKP